MNIKELIEKLKQFDPETLVVVDGYEGGQDDINDIRELTITLHPDTQSWEGKYSDSSIYLKPKNAIKAILLSRHEE